MEQTEFQKQLLNSMLDDIQVTLDILNTKGNLELGLSLRKSVIMDSTGLRGLSLREDRHVMVDAEADFSNVTSYSREKAKYFAESWNEMHPLVPVTVEYQRAAMKKFAEQLIQATNARLSLSKK